LPETPTKIPSDKDINIMQLTILTIFLDKKIKAIAKQSKLLKDNKYLYKKQDIKRSIVNILVILRIINIEI
jgi:hypothetical protein